MDDEFAKNVFSEMHRHWIAPELNRRFGEAIPSDFKISRCLVRLPPGKEPIVQFNDEFGFDAEIKIGGASTLAVGDDVYLHQVERIERVRPISYDGNRVAFMLLISQEGLWTTIFDFAPTDEPLDVATPWRFSDRIAKYIESRMAAHAASLSAAQVERLRRAGLWPAPSILPFPLSRINKHLESGDVSAAEMLLAEHCNAEFLKHLISQWRSVEEFDVRGQLFQEALDAHVRGQFALSIYSLLPQLEGVMTDWLHRKSGLTDVKFRLESKTAQFFQVITAKGNSTPKGSKVMSGTVDFIMKGPVLQTFKNWDEAVFDAFPGRNAISHGKYEQDLFSESNSIKAFLLLDTIFQMLKP